MRIRDFFNAGRQGLPMPSRSKAGTGQTVAIISGAAGAACVVGFTAGMFIGRRGKNKADKADKAE
jgi:hypothetical protein